MISRLLTLVVLLALAWWLWDFAADETKELELGSGPALLYPDLDVDDVTSLYLQLSFGQDLLLERERGGPWFIIEPTREFAMQGLVSQVLDNIARAQVKLVPEERRTADLHAVGLQPPEHKVRIGIDGEERTLLVGALDQFENMLYARRANDATLLLISPNVTSFFEWHGQEWVDPHLIRGLKGSLERLVIDKPDGRVLDAIHEGGRWRFADKPNWRADHERVSQVANALKFVTTKEVAASTVIDAALRETGLPTREEVAAGNFGNAMRIQFTAEGQEPAAIYLGVAPEAPTGDYYMVRDDFGRIMIVQRTSLALLENDTSFFRERSVLPPVRERAAALRILRGDDVLLDIEQGAGAWMFRAPEHLRDEAVESERIEGRSPLGELLFAFDEIEAVGFVEPAGDTEPDVTASFQVTWTRAGRQRQDRVDLLGEPFTDDSGERLWVARASDRPGERLVLDANAIEPLLDPFVAETLRTLKPLVFAESDYAALAIHTPQRAEPFTPGLDDDGTWVGDDELSRQRALAEDIRRSGLRGFRWTPPTESLSRWPYELHYVAADGSDVMTIALRGPRGDEPREAFGKPAAYARISGWPGVELVVPGEWILRFQQLSQPIRRN